MKIVFTDSIFDVISKRLHEGRRDHKKAEYILITPDEHDDLRSDHRFHHHCEDGMRALYSSAPSKAPRDETLRTIDLEDKTATNSGRRSCRFMTTLKFQGIDVYVVPARFM